MYKFGKTALESRGTRKFLLKRQGFADTSNYSVNKEFYLQIRLIFSDCEEGFIGFENNFYIGQ